MKRWLWLAALVLGGMLICLCQRRPAATADTVVKIVSTRLPDSQRFMGAGSCSASACHHGNFSHGLPGSEFTIWITQDRHARAYETLFEDRSRRIQKNLHSDKDAQDDQRCLNCHVHPGLDPRQPPPRAPYFKTDGVSCEACHGPARDWLAEHHLDAWRRKSPAEKQKLGMFDTQSIECRVLACVACHVGAPGMDVDHDLIAAGHPRLNFEFTAYHAYMPHHWPDAKDRDPKSGSCGRQDFEARAWIVGQLISTQAALELLADRAGDKNKTWPEFAEHDCVACHHDLQSPNRRQKEYPAGKAPKAIPWNTWYRAMTPRALTTISAEAKSFGLLDKDLQTGWSFSTNRNAMATKAKQAAADLGKALEQVRSRPTTPHSPVEIFRNMLAEDGPRARRGGDDAAQISLALAGLRQAQLDANEDLLAADLRALDAFGRLLELPRTGLESEAVHSRLKRLTGKSEGR